MRYPITVIGALGALAVALLTTRPVELMQRHLQHGRVNPAAVAQQLAEISAMQKRVLTQQSKLSSKFAGASKAMGFEQELLTKEAPFRLSGYTPPGGGAPAAPVKPW